jgi:hypothetical protein
MRINRGEFVMKNYVVCVYYNYGVNNFRLFLQSATSDNGRRSMNCKLKFVKVHTELLKCKIMSSLEIKYVLQKRYSFLFEK